MSDSRKPERPHRPGRYADLAGFVDAKNSADTTSYGSDSPKAQIAATTAALVLAAGRDEARRREFLELAETVGIDTLAELWCDSDMVSLPGVLWVMYLLQSWCRQQPEEIAMLWRAGSPYAPAEAVVAGVADDADPVSVRALADDVLGGAYGGDFAVALERSASFFRVIAVGRRELASGDGTAEREHHRMAQRNESTAEQLTIAAAYWRQGRLH